MAEFNHTSNTCCTGRSVSPPQPVMGPGSSVADAKSEFRLPGWVVWLHYWLTFLYLFFIRHPLTFLYGIVWCELILGRRNARHVSRMIESNLSSADASPADRHGDPSRPLRGQVAVVTGAAGGMGKEICLGLLALGADTVVMTDRSLNSLLDAARHVRDRSRKAAHVIAIPMDLGRRDSILRFTQVFLSQGLPLHLLINNAGVMLSPARPDQREGWARGWWPDRGDFIGADWVDSSPGREWGLGALLGESSVFHSQVKLARSGSCQMCTRGGTTATPGACNIHVNGSTELRASAEATRPLPPAASRVLDFLTTEEQVMREKESARGDVSPASSSIAAPSSAGVCSNTGAPSSTCAPSNASASSSTVSASDTAPSNPAGAPCNTGGPSKDNAGIEPSGGGHTHPSQPPPCCGLSDATTPAEQGSGVGLEDTAKPPLSTGCWEEHLGVNHLGHFLLTSLLLPVMHRTHCSQGDGAAGSLETTSDSKKSSSLALSRSVASSGLPPRPSKSLSELSTNRVTARASPWKGPQGPCRVVCVASSVHEFGGAPGAVFGGNLHSDDVIEGSISGGGGSGAKVFHDNALVRSILSRVLGGGGSRSRDCGAAGGGVSGDRDGGGPGSGSGSGSGASGGGGGSDPLGDPWLVSGPLAYHPFVAYVRSKCAVVLAAREMAARLVGAYARASAAKNSAGEGAAKNSAGEGAANNSRGRELGEDVSVGAKSTAGLCWGRDGGGSLVGKRGEAGVQVGRAGVTANGIITVDSGVVDRTSSEGDREVVVCSSRGRGDGDVGSGEAPGGYAGGRQAPRATGGMGMPVSCAGLRHRASGRSSQHPSLGPDCKGEPGGSTVSNTGYSDSPVRSDRDGGPRELRGPVAGKGLVGRPDTLVGCSSDSRAVQLSDANAGRRAQEVQAGEVSACCSGADGKGVAATMPFAPSSSAGRGPERQTRKAESNPFARGPDGYSDHLGITVNALHPGVVCTGLWRHVPWFLRPLLALCMALFFRTPREGALCVLHAAAARHLAGITGAYFHDAAPREAAPGSRDPGTQARLWALSCAAAGVDTDAIIDAMVRC
eukprot:jgi/Mesvir1/20578/Mv14819-RA.1